jgi:hypothetical protein
MLIPQVPVEGYEEGYTGSIEPIDHEKVTFLLIWPTEAISKLNTGSNANVSAG